MENSTRTLLVAMLLGMALLFFAVRTAADQSPPAATPVSRCAVIELFLRFEDAGSQKIQHFYRQDVASAAACNLSFVTSPTRSPWSD